MNKSWSHKKFQINPNHKDTYLFRKNVNTRYTCLAGTSSFWWRCLNLIVIFEGINNVPSPFIFIKNRFLDLIVLCQWRNIYFWKNSGLSWFWKKCKKKNLNIYFETFFLFSETVKIMVNLKLIPVQQTKITVNTNT